VQWVLYPLALDKRIFEELDLKEGTEFWDAWVSPPIPIFFNVNFFHVINPTEYESGNALKPILRQVGPYAFDEVNHGC